MAKQDFWYKGFPVTSVCREDLKQNFTEKEIRSLDDGDMARIAEKMGDAYCENGFWIDLSIIARHILDQNKEEQDGKKKGVNR